MSFDPQNPRGSPQPITPSPSSYIPPQPVNRGPSRPLIVGGVAIAILLLGIGVLLLNLLKPPAASPSASPSGPSATTSAAGSQRPSSVPSGPFPTSGVSGSPTPRPSAVAASPGTPAAELLAHIPEGLRPTCTTFAGQDTITASATCTAHGDAISVTYQQYDSASSMTDSYTAAFDRVQIEPDTGSCEDPVTWPAEGAYQVEGAPAGRRLCFNQQGSATILWTDARLNIMSQALTAPGGEADLLQFWTNEAGPLP